MQERLNSDTPAFTSNWVSLKPLPRSTWLQRKDGYRVVAVQNPFTSLADDVAATKRITALQDGPAVLVGHFWGGTAITQAGDNRKVAGLVYVAAYAPEGGGLQTVQARRSA